MVVPRAGWGRPAGSAPWRGAVPVTGTASWPQGTPAWPRGAPGRSTLGGKAWGCAATAEGLGSASGNTGCTPPHTPSQGNCASRRV